MLTLTPKDAVYQKTTENSEKITEFKEVVERVCKDLPFTADIQVLPVKQMRDTVKQVRQRIHGGGITLIAPRGELGDASETTVMISLETLQQLIAQAIGKTLEIQELREHPADILTGLRPITAPDEDRQVDFTTAAKLPAARISPFIKL